MIFFNLQPPKNKSIPCFTTAIIYHVRVEIVLLDFVVFLIKL